MLRKSINNMDSTYIQKFFFGFVGQHLGAHDRSTRFPGENDLDEGFSFSLSLDQAGDLDDWILVGLGKHS